MNDVAAAVLPWCHPVTGLVTVMLAARAASIGFRARRGGRRTLPERAAHAALAAWVWWLVLGNWLLGLATVWVYRPDLELAASTHFLAGTGVLVLLTVARGLSWWIPTHPWARQVHPGVGAAALLLAGVQVFLGLQLTRW